MAEFLINTVYRRLEPDIGWLRFSLLLAGLTIVIAAAIEVGWVPEDHAIIPGALLGFMLALWLAGRHIGAGPAWLLLSAAGLGLSIYLLAHLQPPFEILRQGNPAVANYWEQNMAVFGDRIGGWLESVTAGGRSTETMAFAFGLTLAAWLLGAFLGWTSGRLHKATWGLAALGLALALTSYFGRAGAYWVVAFVGVATVAIAVFQYNQLESLWDRSGTDYSGEVRVELLMYTAAVGLALMSVAYALPVINIRAIAESFRRQPAIAEAEGTLQRVFAGVEQPRPPIEEVSQGATIGVLPRAFLLGEAPELLETVVMTATVTTQPVMTGLPPGYHWRASSYDLYTGRGWLRSPEREEDLEADSQLPIPKNETRPDTPATFVTQHITTAAAARSARYTVGRFLSSNRDSVVYFRGIDDLVRVGDATSGIADYEAVSRAALPSPDDLRLAALDEVPAVILARYTQLPDTVPDRVGDLARQVVGLSPSTLPGVAPGETQTFTSVATSTAPLAATPYDQARALESFLRQYPYSLDVGLPPADTDMVDYFLFDLQSGFCDYYASAMVVMARSLGLPARMAIGFLPQTVDESGQQVLRQKDSHSWAEIYFAGYGWVEFEPTAPIPGQEGALASVAPYGYGPDALLSTAGLVAIPERIPERQVPWPLLLAISVAALAVGAFWGCRWLKMRNRQPLDLDEIQAAYDSLQFQARRLGYQPRPSQTPNEYVDELGIKLQAMDANSERYVDANPKLRRLAEIFGRRQYGHHDLAASDSDTAEAQALWNSVRPELAALASPWRILRRGIGR